MTATNHALTGAVIALAVKQPALALPLALVSHFVGDMIPHWDYKFKSTSPLGLAVRASDFLLAMALLVGFSLSRSWLVLACGLLALLPDFMWWNFFLHGRPDAKDGSNVLHALRRFHIKIQWSETSRGILVEAAWLMVMLLVALKLK